MRRDLKGLNLPFIIPHSVDRVEIVDGDPLRHFAISEGILPNEFNIKTTRTIDREANPYGYNLTIRATDRGRPQRYKSKEVCELIQVCLSVCLM